LGGWRREWGEGGKEGRREGGKEGRREGEGREGRGGGAGGSETILTFCKARAAQAPFEKRVEAAIQNMCRELQTKMDSSYFYYTTILRGERAEVDAMLARSIDRMQQL
jgi:hypothetical protein